MQIITVVVLVQRLLAELQDFVKLHNDRRGGKRMVDLILAFHRYVVLNMRHFRCHFGYNAVKACGIDNHVALRALNELRNLILGQLAVERNDDAARVDGAEICHRDLRARLADHRDAPLVDPEHVQRRAEPLDLVAQLVVGEMHLLLILFINVKVLVAEKRGGRLHHVAQILDLARRIMLDCLHSESPSEK